MPEPLRKGLRIGRSSTDERAMAEADRVSGRRAHAVPRDTIRRMPNSGADADQLRTVRHDLIDVSAVLAVADGRKRRLRDEVPARAAVNGPPYPELYRVLS